MIPTWEEKLEKFAELLSVEINQPAETVSCTASGRATQMGTNDMYLSFSLQIKTAAKLFYKKLELADSFTPKLKLKSKVTLVKPTDNSAKLDEDYRLKEVRVIKRMLPSVIY